MKDFIWTIVVVAIAAGAVRMLWRMSDELYDYARDTERMGLQSDPTGGHARSAAKYNKDAGEYRVFAAGVVVAAAVILLLIWLF